MLDEAVRHPNGNRSRGRDGVEQCGGHREGAGDCRFPVLGRLAEGDETEAATGMAFPNVDRFLRRQRDQPGAPPTEPCASAPG